MLNQRISITEATTPLLQVAPDNHWHIVLKVRELSAESFKFECIKATDNGIESFEYVIEEKPFHVAEGIWDLSYGIQVMTLQHDSLREHPATKLLRQWRQQN